MSEFRPSAYQMDIFNEVRYGRGDIVVSAKAGSGKSTTLREIARRLRSGYTYCFAFNHHIKAHMERVFKEHGINARASTIHGYGYGALRRRFPGLGKPDEDKYRNLAGQIVKAQAEPFLLMQLGVPKLRAEAEKVLRARTQYLTNLARMARVTLADSEDPQDLMVLADKYELGDVDSPKIEGQLMQALPGLLAQGLERIIQSGELDFTDMIWAPLQLDARPYAWDNALVDEAQDLSACQYALVEFGRGRGSRAVWVGDPHQAIMGFAGANARSYADIKERTRATEMPLNVCYRCPKDHIELAKRIVPDIEARPDAPDGVITMTSEEAYLADAEEGDLILCRTTAPLISMCLRLIRRRLPARVRGRDIAKSLCEMAKAIERYEPNYKKFWMAIGTYANGQIDALRQREGTEEKIQRIRDMADALEVCVLEFTSATDVGQLCKEIEAIFTDEEASIWLSTIHRAKGLEAERVGIMRPNLLPFDHPRMTTEQREQEWNLLYVALTRAQETLLFIYEHEQDIPEAPEVPFVADMEATYADESGGGVLPK